MTYKRIEKSKVLSFERNLGEIINLFDAVLSSGSYIYSIIYIRLKFEISLLETFDFYDCSLFE